MPTNTTVTMIYGKVKRGKTLAAVAAYPEAVVVARRGAVEASEKVLGWRVPDNRCLDLTLIGDILTLIPKAAKIAPAIILDDFNLIATNTVQTAERKAGKNKFAFWSQIRNLLIEMRLQAAHCGIDVVITCHERPGRMTSRGPILGGPDLPLDMAEAFPAVADIVGRVVYDSATPVWPYAITVQPSSEWIVGDRTNIILPMPGSQVAMNLGEVLRAGGREVRRPKALQFMDPIVAAVADKLEPLSADEERAALRQIAEKLISGRKPVRVEHVRWILMDATARAAIRRGRSGIGQLAAFWTDPSVGLTSDPTAADDAPSPAAADKSDDSTTSTASLDEPAKTGAAAAAAPEIEADPI